MAENEKLEERVRASEKGKMKDTMERMKLESELKNIQKLIHRIPSEVLAELKWQTHNRGHELLQNLYGTISRLVFIDMDKEHCTGGGGGTLL